MRLKRNGRITSLLLSMMLIFAMAFTAVGCNADKTAGNQAQTETQASENAEATVVGEGQTQFAFAVVDKEGNQTNFEVYTDKTMVGDALLELGLIDGEESEYGLFVKSVNGITADYNVDQTYWAFYVNGEYAMAGVDTTVIEEGVVYSFRVEK